VFDDVTWPIKSRPWPNCVWGVKAINAPFLCWTKVSEVGPWNYTPPFFYIFDTGAVHGPERRLRITPSVRGVHSHDFVVCVFVTRACFICPNGIGDFDIFISFFSIANLSSYVGVKCPKLCIAVRLEVALLSP